MNTIAVLTSGGDAPGMNSSIRAVVRSCAHYNKKCIGIIRGYSGLIENDTKVLNTRSVRGIINRGGTFYILQDAKNLNQWREEKKRMKTLRLWVLMV
jgi:6-phosphofructokinase 1